MDWLEKFPETKAIHLENGSLDNKLLVIFLSGIPKKNQQPWRFK